MHPSKVTLRPKVRRPMAWDSTESAPSVQQPEPSTQCPIPGGHRRAETRHHRIHHPNLLRTARRNQTPSRAILHRVRRTDTVDTTPFEHPGTLQEIVPLEPLTILEDRSR